MRCQPQSQRGFFKSGCNEDFFNRMRAGVLMSRIINDTIGMQAALSQVRQRRFQTTASIVLGGGVLLYMDWPNYPGRARSLPQLAS